MAAVSTTVHHLSPESRVKIQDPSDDEPFSPNSDHPASPGYRDDDKTDEPTNIYTSPFSIHNVLKKERDTSSPDANENVFSTEKLLQNTPNYEPDGKITDYHDTGSPIRNDSPELSPSSRRYEENSVDEDNPSNSNPDSVRADINVEDDVSCCSDDTVLSVGNEAPLSNFNSSAESTSKSTPNSPGTPPTQGLTSFKHIQTHLNAISQLSQNLTINPPLLLRPNPITPNPLLFLNQSHLLFQNPLLNQVDTLKSGLNPVVTRPGNVPQTSPPNPFSNLNQFGMRIKQNGLTQSTSQDCLNRNRPDENLRSFINPKSMDDESRRDLINQNCLKFSIDNILKADFGRRITDPLNKRKVQKVRPSFDVPKPCLTKEPIKPDSQLEARVPEIKPSDKSVAIDLSKADDGGSGSSQGSVSGSQGGDGPMVWPAWVYCTRYSDRPSSGEYFF